MRDSCPLIHDLFYSLKWYLRNQTGIMLPSLPSSRCIVPDNVVCAEVVCGTSWTRFLKSSLSLHLPRFLAVSFHSLGTSTWIVKVKNKLLLR